MQLWQVLWQAYSGGRTRQAIEHARLFGFAFDPVGDLDYTVTIRPPANLDRPQVPAGRDQAA